METPNTPAPITEVNNLVSVAQNAALKLPEWTGRADRADAALSQITAITTDEEDTRAERLLVRVRETYQHINTERLNLTSFFDKAKQFLMAPEKRLTDETGTEFSRVKKMRDGYATEKARRIEAERAEAARQQARREEGARLTKRFQDRFFANVVTLTNGLHESLSKFLAGFTLENFDANSNLLKITPKIKEATFQSWFEIETTLAPEDKALFMEQVRAQYTYERINGEYQTAAAPIIQQYIDKLPALKTELEAMASKSAEDAEAQRVDMEKQRAADLQKQKDEAERVRIANEAETQRQADNEKLAATFAAQVTLQEQEVLKGVRTTRFAIVDCPQEDIVRVFAEVLFACFVNKKFPGYLKTDKKGNVLPADENGVPVYTKWAEELLSFYAQNCDVEVKGIRFVEKISTVQRTNPAPTPSLL